MYNRLVHNEDACATLKPFVDVIDAGVYFEHAFQLEPYPRSILTGHPLDNGQMTGWEVAQCVL